MFRKAISAQDVLIAISLLLSFGFIALLFAAFAEYSLQASLDAPTGKLLSIGMLLLMLVLVVRYLLMLGLAVKDVCSQKSEHELFDRTYWPSVSLIVPVYNESKLIGQVLERLFELDYPDYELIVIDDGSSDHTYLRAMLAAKKVETARVETTRMENGHEGNVRVRILSKPNGGKSDALNHGLAHASGEIVVCVDGDAVLDPKALKWVVAHFDNPVIGAVAGNVRVSNRDTAWGMFQALEYTLGLGLMKRAQSAAGAVAIVPGPLGAFRKQAVARAGGYDHDTYAEDFDLTLKMLEDGWQIVYESRACVFTEVPETLMQLMKQRYRWSRGAVQVLRKRWQMLSKPFSAPLGVAGVGYLMLEMLVMPLAHIAGLVLFAWGGLTTGTDGLVGIWWMQLLVLDTCIALFCVIVERESWALVAAAPFSRVFYQVILDVLRIFATIEEFLGIKMTWGKLKRLGKMS